MKTESGKAGKRGKRTGPPLGEASRAILGQLLKHPLRDTHQLAEVIGLSAYRTTTKCQGLMRAGYIRRLAKGKPGKNGLPAVWERGGGRE